jgi:transposase
VRDFARASGLLAKTDRIDAQVLSRFAEVMRPRVLASDDSAREELSALEASRRQLSEMVTSEKNRLRSASRM